MVEVTSVGNESPLVGGIPLTLQMASECRVDPVVVGPEDLVGLIRERFVHRVCLWDVVALHNAHAQSTRIW